MAFLPARPLATLGAAAALTLLGACDRPSDTPASAAAWPPGASAPASAPGPGAAPSVAAASPSPPAAPAAPATVAAPNFSALVTRVGPAVVNVTTSRNMSAMQQRLPPGSPDPLREFFRRFAPPPDSGGREFRSLGVGSGFIIDAQGYVLTNAHVVAEADEVLVRLADDKGEYKARVVGTDPQTDVALLKVDATGLPVVKLGDSDRLQAGEWVAAIGSPFGFANTITAGIVSAKERSLPDETFVPFIQTDVAVNPGNSGGPLLNVAGEVVGINSQIYSQTGGYMGLSFAVPIGVAMEVARQLRADGKVTRGRLGVAIQEVSAPLARSFRLDAPRGALVTDVEPNGPAQRAGVAPGDIILGIGGEPVPDATALPRRVAQAKPGSELPLEVWRDGQRRTLTVTVGQAPTPVATVAAAPPQRPAQAAASGGRLGLHVSELPREGRRALGVDYGLVVERIEGVNADAPLQRGDVIIGLNQQRLRSLGDFNRRMNEVPGGGTVAALVRRGPATLYVPLEVAAG